MLESRPATTVPTASSRDGSKPDRWLSRLDSPLVNAAAAAIGGVAFVLCRLAVVGKGDITRFVMAGRDFVDPSRSPAGLHVFPGGGYDGQFYYRLALDPLDLSRTAFGITIDAWFRIERIGLPALSWVASGGQHSLVPDAEVALDLFALVFLAYLGGVLARDGGRHVAWGLLVAGFWGFLFSIGRDLPEVVASCFLVGGLLAMRRSRHVLCGLLFAAASLTLETTLDVVVAVAIVCIVELVRRRRLPGARDAAWVIPGVTFVAWQVVGWLAAGTLPMRTDAGDNLGIPFVAMVGAIVHYLVHFGSVSSLVWLGECFVLGVVTLFAAGALRRSHVPSWEKVAWLISLLVAASLAHGIWYGKANFRGFEDLYLLSTLVLLGSRHRLWVVAVLVALVWAVTFGHYVVAL